MSNQTVVVRSGVSEDRARPLVTSRLLIPFDYGLFNSVRPVGPLSDSSARSQYRVVSGVIIITTQILALGLGKIRQPKVIAEVLGGIVLGPTLMGRIPGFTEHIFPTVSRPYLALTADIGELLP